MRGSTGSVDEMSFIIRHSGSRGVVVQDAATLRRLLPGLTATSSSNGQSSLQVNNIAGVGTSAWLHSLVVMLTAMLLVRSESLTEG